MNALCILCESKSPIENSHIVSKFVVRRIKAGTPHGTLRHSDDLKRSRQDGWKAAYLCAACEAKLGKWEDWFSRTVFVPYTKHVAHQFPMTERLVLFAASLHLRCIRRAFDLHPTASEARLTAMYENLRQVCRDGTHSPRNLHFY